MWEKVGILVWSCAGLVSGVSGGDIYNIRNLE